MYVMIDNYDSFVYNLAAYCRELGRDVIVVRNDKVDEVRLKELWQKGTLQGIIISPGPKRPEDSGASLSVLAHFEGQVPILGVCLGHQTIAHHYGGVIRKGKQPMHGKISPVYHDASGLFQGIPSGFRVTRYHSLVVEGRQLPACLRVCAVAEDGEIMAIHHKNLPVYGVQFHPEAVLTEYGHYLLKNFMHICEGVMA
ncbi:MAG TPA: aminodeoxychorismate/anthranilate synthase component II [Clostridiales bacterium]|nr:aminodeoxychorismate/anthranilate synthase component II [Clostridiales bacterium]